MTGLSLLILLAGAAAIVLAVRFYLRGEVSVPGRPVLVGLRVALLAILILLLLDVRLPGGDPTATAARGAWLLLDGDLSLVLPSDDGARLWDRAVERAEALGAEGMRVALAAPGERGPEGTAPAALRSAEPRYPPGDLLDGILRLAEAGADSVTILSSFRRPPELLERIRAEAPVPVHLERVGGPTRNAGVAELELPSVVPEGEEVEGRVSIFGEGGEPGDSVAVEIERDGEPVERFFLPLPAPGETAAADFLLPPLPDTGWVRYAARVGLEGDPFEIDDARARWLRVGEPEGRIFLLSLRPDWEPRFLLPVLGAVTGLETEGYLAVGEARFLPLVAGGEGARPVPEDELRERGERAALVVLHGAGGDGEVAEWVANLVREHPRVLHLPAGPEGAALGGVATGPPASGEWASDPETPPSPLAPFLSGLPLGGLPPLVSPLPPDGEPDGLIVLRLRGPSAGQSLPLLVFREEEGLRRAVALASGFWRWGSRDGDARRAYRSLWGGVTNWLLAPTGDPEPGEVRPVEIVQPRGTPLRWHVPDAAGGVEVVLRSAEEPEVEVFRGPVVPGTGGVGTTPPVDPGVYRFEVRAEDGSAAAEGWVEVERWAGSLRRPPLELTDARIAPSEEAAPIGPTEGRSLRTHPAPYLLALLLLSAEWIWRRRVGLR